MFLAAVSSANLIALDDAETWSTLELSSISTFWIFSFLLSLGCVWIVWTIIVGKVDPCLFQPPRGKGGSKRNY